jgi:mannosyltransferase OCH1-like enzyme
MIPKVIHYCWFGGRMLPESAKKCIVSWRKFLPDYKIKEWNENNFDVKAIPYTAEAYASKKYAFVSDYARFWILYHEGGIYFDTDVEMIKPIDDIIAKGSFMGIENGSNGVAPGLGIGFVKNHFFLMEVISSYKLLHFKNNDGSLNKKTVVEYTTDLLKKYGFKKIDEPQFFFDIFIYSSDYFCPISIIDGKLYLSKNTRTIHHYAASWVSPWHKWARKMLLIIGGRRLKELLSKVDFLRFI